MTSVTLVDLGLGNMHSVAQALARAGAEPRLVREPAAAKGAERLVVPGQGAFRDCGAALMAGWGDMLRDFLATERPYLGICLGMQLLFEGSDEAPDAEGLGWVGGRVTRFAEGRRDEEGKVLKVPHMGWASIQASHPLVDNDGWYYFVHSYRCEPSEDVTVATANYGGDFCAAIAKGSVFACQFHPEKSQLRGQRLLQRFLQV
ncbi:MAG: imidazole glycerol phosphate synthase subunit HisH [Myxococcota bacterium]